MNNEINHTQKEAKHIADRLHHLPAGHNELALKNIRKELEGDHTRNPKHFNELLKDVKQDLKKEHDHRHLGIEHDRTGRVSHVSFDQHDIYGRGTGKKHDEKDIKKTKTADKTDSLPVDGSIVGQNGKLVTPSDVLRTGERSTSKSPPPIPDISPASVSEILQITGSGAPTPRGIGMPVDRAP